MHSSAPALVESGEERVGQWINVRRNVLEDCGRAFGEDPGDMVAVGAMTDSGDDGSTRRILRRHYLPER